MQKTNLNHVSCLRTNLKPRKYIKLMDSANRNFIQLVAVCHPLDKGRGACSVVWLFAIPWTVTPWTLLSVEFSRQEYWSGLPFSTPGDLPDPGIEPASLESPVVASSFLIAEPPGKPCYGNINKAWHRGDHILLLYSHILHSTVFCWNMENVTLMEKK